MTYEYLLKKYGLTLSFEEAGAELGLHFQTVRQMCQRGDIKATRRCDKGGKWILTTKALADYIDSVSLEKEKAVDILPIPKTGRGYKKII